MLYSFELQMMGVILLTAMFVGGISLWYKRRKLRKELEAEENDDAQKPANGVNGIDLPWSKVRENIQERSRRRGDTIREGFVTPRIPQWRTILQNFSAA